MLSLGTSFAHSFNHDWNFFLKFSLQPNCKFVPSVGVHCLVVKAP